jgi:hypothetical protein
MKNTALSFKCACIDSITVIKLERTNRLCTGLPVKNVRFLSIARDSKETIRRFTRTKKNHRGETRKQKIQTCVGARFFKAPTSWCSGFQFSLLRKPLSVRGKCTEQTTPAAHEKFSERRSRTFPMCERATTSSAERNPDAYGKRKGRGRERGKKKHRMQK